MLESKLRVSAQCLVLSSPIYHEFSAQK